MKHLAIVLCVFVAVSACTSKSARLPTSPSLASTPSAAATPTSVSPAAITMISVGKDVTGTLRLHGTENVYELTAASSGTLVARISWTPAQGRLELWLANTPFANYPDNASPVVGRLPVVAGQKYQIRVLDGAPWDYDDLSLPYVLATVIE